MEGYINDYNFFEMEAMKYYAAPSTWSKEKKNDTAKNRIFSGEWGAAEKKDGFFAKVIKDEDGNLLLTSRNRNTKGVFVNKIEWVPQVIDFLESLPNGTCLLAELYLPSKPGAKNTQTILGCLKDKAIARQEKDEKIHMYVFDCLAYNNVNLINTMWKKRIKKLDLMRDIKNQYVEIAFISYGKELWERLGDILALGGEGIVLMSNDGTYIPGKRPSNVAYKIKKEINQTIDCIFTGHFSAPSREYSGKEIKTWKYWENLQTGEKIEGVFYKEYSEGMPYEPITKPYFYGWAGSLEIGLVKGDKVVSIGYLSSLSDEIKANPEKYKGRPIEVTCMEVMEGTNGLRHAKMLQFRDDLTIRDCTWEKVFGV